MAYQFFCASCKKGIVLDTRQLPEQLQISCETCQTHIFSYNTQPYPVPKAIISPDSGSEKLFVGKYKIIRRLGSGAFGMVYQMEEIATGEMVAVKIMTCIGQEDIDKFLQYGSELQENYDDYHQQMFDRFHREACIMRTVDHSNIPKIKEVGNWNGQPYLAMEYFTGKTLAAMVKENGPMDQTDAVEYICTLGLTIYYLYSKFTMLHRDIKPENIIMHKMGNLYVPKLIDLGMGKLMDEVSMTKSHMLMGTPWYMAPEQMNAKYASHAADQYALGSVLYFMLCGKPPYCQFSGNMNILRAKAQGLPYLPLRELMEELGRELNPFVEKAIDRAMDFSPEKRFPDTKEMVRFLRENLN